MQIDNISKQKCYVFLLIGLMLVQQIAKHSKHVWTVAEIQRVLEFASVSKYTNIESDFPVGIFKDFYHVVGLECDTGCREQARARASLQLHCNYYRNCHQRLPVLSSPSVDFNSTGATLDFGPGDAFVHRNLPQLILILFSGPAVFLVTSIRYCTPISLSRWNSSH